MARRRDVKQRGVFERPKRSGVFWVRYYDHGREFREKVGTKSDAVDRYRQRKTEAREGRLPVRNRDRLFAEFVREYLESERPRMRSFVNYARYGRVWSERFAGRRLRSILPMDIERWLVKAAQSLAPASLNRELSFLRRVFNVALANDLVDRNPVKRVKFFCENNARVRFLSEEEEAALRKEIGEERWPLVAFALHTGLRQGEQFNLRWQYADLTNRVLTIPRSKHGGARHVYLNDTALAILQGIQTRLKSPWVFASQNGRTPLDAKNFVHRVFVPALKRARIEDFHWHDARHTFASRLVMRGADLRTVQELMGHKTLAMTLRYSHLSPAHRLAAVQLLDTERGGQTGTKPAPEAPDKSDRGLRSTGQVLEMPKEKGSEPSRDRTVDPLVKSQMLYRLS